MDKRSRIHPTLNCIRWGNFQLPSPLVTDFYFIHFHFHILLKKTLKNVKLGVSCALYFLCKDDTWFAVYVSSALSLQWFGCCGCRLHRVLSYFEESRYGQQTLCRQFALFLP